jgi:hypothetical protein
MGGEEIEVANEIKYLGIILDGRGKWEKEKRQVGIRGKIALNSINICLAGAPNMGINILEQLYVSLIESRIMTGVEIWGLDDGWRESLRDVLQKNNGGTNSSRHWCMCVGIGKDK